MNAPFNAPVQVRQLAQYGRTDAAIPGTVTLMQMGEAGAPYASILTSNLVSSALAAGGNLNLLAGLSEIVFGFDKGAGAVVLSVVQGELQVSPSLRTSKLDATFVNGISVTQNGVPVATQVDLAADRASSVTSFNRRTGDILLETADIMRAGGAPQNSPVFSGWVIAPSFWDTRICDDTVVTANWVHRLLCAGAVTSFNGRTGPVTLTTADVNAAYAVPGVSPTAPSPVLGDSSNRIATTSFVDESLADAVFTGSPGAPGPPGAAGPAGPAGAGFGININSLTSSPLVPDGVTSNVTQLQSLGPVLQSVGPEFPVPVTLTVGSPTVVSLNTSVVSGGVMTDNTHFLKPNQAFHFIVSAGGSLPSGISPGTTYYITAANLAATTFTFSATNNYGPLIGEGAPVNTTGALTGTASIVLTGRDLNISIPPGPYFCGYYGDSAPNINVTPNGMSRIRYWAYGAMFDTKVVFGVYNYMADAKTWSPQVFDYVNTTPNENATQGLDAQIVLQTAGNAANYYVGQWISIFGVDLQNPLGTYTSGPPNNQFQEYKRIKAINVSTNTITCDGPLRWIYLSTFPNLTNAPARIGGGVALIAQMHPAWDADIEVRGARWAAQPAIQFARRFSYIDCVFQGYGNNSQLMPPSATRASIYKNCKFGPVGGNAYFEIDKMIEYLEIDGCFAPNHFSFNFYSVSLHECLIRNLSGARIAGTPRQIRIADSEFDTLLVGPLIGITDGVQVQNSRISYFDMQQRLDDLSGTASLSVNNDMNLVANWTFSNGTFTRNITGLPISSNMGWMIPGAKVYFADAGRVYQYFQNMGSPFTILNVTLDGSGNFSFSTTLAAVPTRQVSSVVTLTVASPGVVNWTAHGLAANTPVVFNVAAGGALPTGLSRSTLYFVSAPLANSFNVSATSGGAAINFTGTTSGAVTASANPLAFRPHPCPRFTGTNNSGNLNLADQNGAIDEPLFSRVKRAFGGRVYNGSWVSFTQPASRIWGNLISMTVNVVKASTAGTLNINSPGFVQGNPPSLTLSTFNQTVDLTQVGKRVVTNTTVTGNLGTDALTAYPDWVAGPLVFTPAAIPQTLQGGPIVLFEMLTDQGITRFGNLMGGPGAPATFVWMYNDSGIIQQYGTSP